MVGHGGSSAGSYLANPTSPIPCHCASIVVTNTLRVKISFLLLQKQTLSPYCINSRNPLTVYLIICSSIGNVPASVHSQLNVTALSIGFCSPRHHHLGLNAVLSHAISVKAFSIMKFAIKFSCNTQITKSDSRPYSSLGDCNNLPLEKLCGHL